MKQLKIFISSSYPDVFALHCFQVVAIWKPLFHHFVIPDMSHKANESVDRRELVNIPTYTITRRDDLSLQFDPPVGSRELANALSFKFPFLGSLQQQIQHALLEHIDSERPLGEPASQFPRKNQQDLSREKRTVTDLLPTPSPAASNPSQVALGHPEDYSNLTTVWNITTGEPLQRKRKKTTYDDNKRRQVAEVRRHRACPFHRTKKTAVRNSSS
jgi:hypothetical protein